MDDTPALIRARGEGIALDDLPSFEAGGSRARLFFDPKTVRAGIVTCGGLCPGLNNVVRAVVRSLQDHYGVTEVRGYRNGYLGLNRTDGPEPLTLTREMVAEIHLQGGTMLGSSRGAQDVAVMVDTLVADHINMLFVVGGDGSMRGAHAIATEVAMRGLSIAVVGIPKTIDNDLPHIGQSFGFETAYARAAQSVIAAEVEAEGAVNGIGIVQTMGRNAGFIACYSALAAQTANFVLIPENPFSFEGDNGLLAHIRRRVDRRGHAVIVVAEGAGQEHMASDGSTDASGNKVLSEFGRFLRQRIRDDYSSRGEEVNIRYFDPGYFIRSVPTPPTRSTAPDWPRPPSMLRWPDAPTWSSVGAATGSCTCRSPR